MRPIVHGLEAEYAGQLDMVYLDHLNPDNTEMIERYSFRWRPLFILVRPDGTEVERWFGYVEEDVLRASFDALLAEYNS